MSLQVKAIFQSRIPIYARELLRTVDAATQQAALGMVEVAQATVRKDTESLVDTIDISKVDAVPMVAAYSVNAGDVEGGYKGKAGGRSEGAPVDYAIAQEYGPGEHTPYMTPAAEEGWANFLRLITVRVGSMT